MTKKTIMVDVELWEQFKSVAKSNGYSIKGALGLMIRQFIEKQEGV